MALALSLSAAVAVRSPHAAALRPRASVRALLRVAHRSPQQVRALSQRGKASHARTALVACASSQEASTSGTNGALPQLEDRADSILPDSLEDAVETAGRSCIDVMDAGGQRVVVELLIPELENRAEEGDQQRIYNLMRRFMDALQANLDIGQNLKAVLPDVGAAAWLKSLWTDATFSIASLTDRQPISESDKVVVLLAPDYQMLKQVTAIGTLLADEEGGNPRPLIMWNPALQSGDVGIGLNVRRMRDSFLNTFAVAYSLRPLPGGGSVFRKYPLPWQVFLEDPELEGRYKLVAERDFRPSGDALENIILEADAAERNETPSAAAEAMGMLASLQRFMRSLSK
eukprot:jgi/Chlat1/1636/Chrsp127S01947